MSPLLDQLQSELEAAVTGCGVDQNDFCIVDSGTLIFLGIQTSNEIGLCVRAQVRNSLLERYPTRFRLTSEGHINLSSNVYVVPDSYLNFGVSDETLLDSQRFFYTWTGLKS